MSRSARLRSERCFRRRRACALAFGLVFASTLARAQTRGAPLAPREFNIDLVTGPVVGPNSTMALGGAYTALGFGIDAAALTPVAYPARTLWDTNWFEFDVTAGYTPGAFQTTDFDNNGRAGVTFRDYYFLSGGAKFTFGELGVGSLVRVQNYRLGARAGLNMLTANYGAGYSFLEGQLLVAGSGRTLLVDLDPLTEGGTEAHYSASGPELGVILALEDQPYRIGFAARTQVEATESRKTGTVNGLILPAHVILPAELQVGFAYQFGPRPLNRRWQNPHDVAREMKKQMLARRQARQYTQLARERSAARLLHSADTAPPLWAAEGYEQWEQPHDPEFWAQERVRRPAEELELEKEVDRAEIDYKRTVRSLSRRYLMLSLDAIVISPIEDGIGFESFMSQMREASGKSVTFGVRFGAEGEPIENRLKLRVGTYLEPSRFEAGSPRVHATLGSDVKLFSWDVFGILSPVDLRIGAAVDVAVRYVNYGFSLGVWH
ncbi:MAG TPA: hypothetical protein VFG30_00075 [Polyangiales bacterium]|nr:hypothetical protein [Polyangiales bacterium]